MPLSSAAKWIKPSQGVFKTNMDAAFGSSYSVIATVTRDWRGTVVLAQSLKVNTSIPFQAEATTLVWAFNLVVAVGFECVIF
jgi:hypothetical protein